MDDLSDSHCALCTYLYLYFTFHSNENGQLVYFNISLFPLTRGSVETTDFDFNYFITVYIIRMKIIHS